jgi:pimeloyl-ACP methyl ester carboxylesterase
MPEGPADKTVLLVHGWEGRGSQLGAFVDPLVERGFRVVTFDAPGHGDSTLARGSIVEHERALHSIAREIGPVHAVIAHSVGGAAALLATRRGFHAERFALICPPAAPSRFAAGFARMLKLNDAIRDAMVARVEARYGMRFEELDVHRDAERLQAPVLVVHDRDDAVVPFADGASIAQSAPRGELVAVSGLGHSGILRASTVIDRVTRYVAGDAAPTFAETLDGELYMRDRRWAAHRERAVQLV